MQKIATPCLYLCSFIVVMCSVCSPGWIHAAGVDTLGIGNKDSGTTGYTTAVKADSVVMNTDAIYTRPFIIQQTGSLAVGGYLEANLQHAQSNGIGSGTDFQARRFTMFMAGTPSQSLRFLAELEFENGTEEINLEFASLDILLSRLVILRAGILMIPIGGFNQNHDGPRWNFIDRPMSATQLLPATWSAVGMGMLGKTYTPVGTLSYELYGSNGLDESIVSNSDRRTSLAAAKSNPLRFTASSNGHVMVSARTGLSTPQFGELGLSYAGGRYNQTQLSHGIPDKSLWLHCAAVDYGIGTLKSTWFVKVEAALVHVELPEASEPVYASNQLGGYLDVNHALWRGDVLGFRESMLSLGLRAEYVDFHLHQSSDVDADADDVFSSTIALAFHPASGSNVRVNYRHTWQRDLIGNEPIATGLIQIGITSYF